MDTVYIETSVISHASAWPSLDPVVAVLQQQARQWWRSQRPNYQLVTSQLVVDEASVGDADAARRRLEMLDGISLLLLTDQVEQIATEIIRRSLMPAKAKLDALHVACAAVGGADYLLTQNCKHIANAHVLPQVYDMLDELGLPRLLICMPAEFLGDPGNDDESDS